jgi:hypothetical protein
LCFLWYIYFTKFHKGVTKFHKGLQVLPISLKFSLCFPPWRSDIFSLCFLWYIYLTCPKIGLH